MIFKQKKNGWDLSFEFEEDQLVYSLVTDTEKSRTKIPYLEITNNTWEHIRKNDWFKHVGLIWLGIGLFINILSYTESKTLTPSIWLILGAVMLAVYHVRQIKFLVVGAGPNNILIIQDKKSNEILNHLMTKRNESVLKTYGTVNFDNTLENELLKFKALLDQEFITKSRYEEAEKELTEYHKNKPVLSPITSFK